ncbi:hypothetical protein DSCA_23030 [Desulfosarcina alkanivorans]|uniref:Ice-binding protein C-terminal domain-containing protein n=1 Tax=Desulfosarcina alkanivorans TaxID=571177 RepID=A0A5K7YIL0_9BACT|nr:VPLPA-CTERM sorting domain-containing protein [Desulfosarcina alkanivorans]BBO68373.1 hypothetical protein DSCA_23030 [Desulfosarcina alkanivorans]
MKRVFLAILVVVFLSGAANADIILFEDFEDTDVAYTTSVPEFTDNYYDFFLRTDGSDHNSSITYDNVQGDYYFAGMDLDGEGATLPLTMTFAGIDISGYSDLTFSSLFAEDTASDDVEDWDLPDSFKVEYRIDGGAYQNLLAFESIPDGDNFNAVPALDTDFDGNGDGTELTDVLSLFSASIVGTGDVLDVRFTFDLDSGDEDIAIDNVQINGVSAVPVPAAVWLLGSGLVGLIGIRRKTA